MGRGKSSGGNSNGNGNGNKIPPSGPLSAASSSADGDDQNIIKSAWTAYNSNLDKYPIITKAITSMVGFALGDFLAQKFIDKSENIDLKRLGRMASFGALIHGPTGHFFYGMLDSKIPGTAALTVATKVFIDQVIWNPIFGIMFFSYMGAAEGLNACAIKTRIEKNLLASVKGSWTVWPVAHAINFRFVPTSQRLLYINSIQIGYNMFLSVLSKRASSSDAAPEVAKGKKGKKVKA
jgi:protein Mpv17